MADLSVVHWRVLVAGRRIPCILRRVYGVVQLRVPAFPHVQVSGSTAADALARAEAALRPIVQPSREHVRESGVTRE